MRPSPQRFSLRPYNRFDPAFTTWWLVPSSDWPAYSHGKLFLQRENEPDDNHVLVAGFYLEKGLGSGTAGMSGVPRTKIMTATWRWHEFIAAAAGGRVESTIVKTGRLSGRPVVVRLDAWPFNSAPDFDEDVLPSEETLRLVSGPAALHSEPALVTGSLFRPLADCVSLQEMASSFQQLDGLDYFWVDLTIGVSLRFGNVSSGQWGAAKLWHDALEPWNRWAL